MPALPAAPSTLQGSFKVVLLRTRATKAFVLASIKFITHFSIANKIQKLLLSRGMGETTTHSRHT